MNKSSHKRATKPVYKNYILSVAVLIHKMILKSTTRTNKNETVLPIRHPATATNHPLTPHANPHRVMKVEYPIRGGMDVATMPAITIRKPNGWSLSSVAYAARSVLLAKEKHLEK